MDVGYLKKMNSSLWYIENVQISPLDWDNMFMDTACWSFCGVEIIIAAPCIFDESKKFKLSAAFLRYKIRRPVLLRYFLIHSFERTIAREEGKTYSFQFTVSDRWSLLDDSAVNAGDYGWHRCFYQSEPLLHMYVHMLFHKSLHSRRRRQLLDHVMHIAELWCFMPEYISSKLPIDGHWRFSRCYLYRIIKWIFECILEWMHRKHGIY